MRIKLLQSRVGLDFSQAVGEEIEVGDAEAVRMIEAGQAIPVVPAIERAVRAAAETRDPFDHDHDGKGSRKRKGK